MKLITNIILLIIAIISVVSCNKYLDVEPDTSLNVAIDSEDKIAELLTGAYPTASYFSFLETRTDNVDKRENGVHSSLNEAMYNWYEYDQEDLDTPLNYWRTCYKGIAQANKALELLIDYPKTERVKALYGEAFLLRAYFHFMLVNIWSHTYRGELSKNDMGIPYVTKSEKNAIVEYRRGNVYDVYKKIEKDLKLGITLVNDKYYNKEKFHFNKKAAYAFASRFYLLKGDWDLVIEYSNYVLGGSKKTLRNWRAYRKEFGYFNTKLIYQKYANKAEEANLLITTTESRQARELPIETYGMTRNLILKIYKTLSPYHIFTKSPKPINDGMYMAKFDELSLFGITGTKPRDLYVSNVILTTDEVALNRIEAYTMKKNYDKAILLLKAYIQEKFDRRITASEEFKFLTTSDEQYVNYSPFYGLTIKQLALVKTVVEYRRQEFMHEGLRWFDIRRFYTPIKRTSNPLMKDDFRKSIQLPIEAINRGLEANPR